MIQAAFKTIHQDHSNLTTDFSSMTKTKCLCKMAAILKKKGAIFDFQMATKYKELFQ